MRAPSPERSRRVTDLRAHDHPDYVAEAEYLKTVLQATELSIADIESRSWRGSGKLADLETDEILRGWAEYRKLALRTALGKPYFGRIDFASGPSSSYYIGQTGVKEPESRERLVIDWRICCTRTASKHVGRKSCAWRSLARTDSF